jgi:hypothetical protein
MTAYAPRYRSGVGFLFGLTMAVTGAMLLPGLSPDLLSTAKAQAPEHGLSLGPMPDAEFDLSVERFRVLEQQAWTSELERPDGADLAARLWSCNVGDPDSPPLLLVTSADNTRVWVDQQRAGQWVEATERSSLAGLPADTLRIDVLAQSTSAERDVWPTPQSIRLLLHYHAALDVWTIATLLGWHGSLEIDGQPLRFQLVDGNFDGRLDSPSDLLRVDLNRNGSFEAIREQFPMTRLWRLAGRRFALGIDQPRRQFTPREINQLGTIEVVFPQNDFQQPPSEFSISLVSDTGIHVAIEGTAPVAVPVGEYRLLAASLLWSGETKARATFSQDHLAGSFHTVQVRPDELTRVMPLGMLEVGASLVSRGTEGNEIQIQPFMRSDTGMYLTRYSTGKVAATLDGTLYAYAIRKSDAAETIVARGSTQFACGTFCPIRLVWQEEQPSHIQLEFDSGPMAKLQRSDISLEQLTGSRP